MRHLITAGLITASFLTPAFIPTDVAAAEKKEVSLKSSQSVVPTVALTDLSQNFLEFYDRASKPAPAPVAGPDGKIATIESESDRRWRLYEKYYGFRAQQTDTEARTALDAAWPKYAAVAKQLEDGFDAVIPKPVSLLNALNADMLVQRPLAIKFIAYVGMFQNRVWVKSTDSVFEVNLPLETPGDERTFALAHALARLTLNASSSWPAGNPRNVAELVMGEGVLAHSIENAIPGKSLENYLGVSAEQLQKLKDGRKTSAKALFDKLASTNVAEYQSGDKLLEARYLGYLLVETQLKKVSLADLLRQDKSDLAKGLMVPTLRIGK